MKPAFIFLVIFINALKAQIPNAGFEYWSSVNPDNWQTTNIPILPPSVLMDSDSFTGMLSVKGIVVGDGDNHAFQPYLGISGAASQGFFISNSYDRFNGWFKSSLIAGDFFIGEIRMFNSNQETIANGSLIISSTQSSWTEFNVVINYLNSDTPVSCTIFFTISDSSLISSGHIGSYFLIDELSLTQTVGITSPHLNELTINSTPGENSISINNFDDKNLQYLLVDINGKIILSPPEYYHGEIISLGNLSCGVYFLNIFSNQDRIVKKVLVTL
jgi:hypothetical protein